MMQPVDPELFNFAARVIEKFGGVTEAQNETYLSLLPTDLAKQLEIPEECVLGSDAAPLIYGHPLLERLVHLSVGPLPILYARLVVPYLKSAGFDQLVASEYNFNNGKCRVINHGETRSTYAILYSRYLALSDQRKEGLFEISVHEGTGAVISNFENRVSQFAIEYPEQNQIPGHFPDDPQNALNAALKHSRHLVEQELREFLDSIQRHLNRDVKNTREYYAALQNEMEASLQRPNLSQNQIDDRKSKIADLPHELERKIADLEQKYQVTISLSVSGLMRYLVPVVQLSLELIYRKIRRNFPVRFNPITYKLDPLVCEKCQKSIYDIHIIENKGALSFRCQDCAT